MCECRLSTRQNSLPHDGISVSRWSGDPRRRLAGRSAKRPRVGFFLGLKKKKKKCGAVLCVCGDARRLGLEDAGGARGMR